MDLNYFQKNLGKREESTFKKYVQEKLESIESLLTKFADDAQLLKIAVEKFEKHDAFEVEFCLILPTKTLVAKEASHTLTKAIDQAKDRLIAQIKKHVAHLRKERAHKSIRDTEEVSEKVEIWQ